MVEASDQAERAESKIFTSDELVNELRQSEILSGVARHIYQYSESNTVSVADEINPFVVIVSQDCDLLRNFTERQQGTEGGLLSVLMYAATPAEQMRETVPRGRDIWKRIIQNNDERYHFLQAVPSKNDRKSAGMPSLIIDFRRYFTLSPTELYKQIETGSAARRCMLLPRYKEHLQTRAAFYFQRVTLALPHQPQEEV